MIIVLKCPMCTHKDHQYIKNRDFKSNYVKCGHCGSVYSQNYIAPEALENFYEKFTGYDIPELTGNVEQTLRSWVTSFEQYRVLNKICDIGFGAGFLLKIASEEGWGCSGNEFSAQSIRIGEQNGWEVSLGALNPGNLTGPFDVVTLIETVEHVPSPGALIHDAAARLRQGGIIFGTTPNANSLNSLLFGGAWDIYTYPNHLVIHTKKSLRMNLELAGFDHIKIHSQGFNPYNFINWLRSAGKKKSDAFSQKKTRTELGIAFDTSLRSNLIGKFIKRAAQTLLRSTGLGDTLVFKATKIEPAVNQIA